MSIGRLLRIHPAVIVLAQVCAVLAATLTIFDPDYFWHLKAGEWFVTHRALAPGDVFSFTRTGRPWMQHEWLFEIVLYEVFRHAGTLGVKLLTVGLFMTAFGLVCRTAYRHAPSPEAVAVMACASLWSYTVGLAPRPQLVTYIGIALTLAVLLEFKYRRALRPLAVLPPFMLLWVNCHGGYVLGTALMLLFAASECYVSWCATGEHRADRRQLAWLGAACVASVLATLANPWFLDAWRFPIAVLGMHINDFLTEWRSPDFHLLVPQTYLIVALLFATACAKASRHLDLTEWVLPTTFLLLGFTAVRHMPLAALTVIPCGAAALARGRLLDDIRRPGLALAGAVERGLRTLRAAAARRWPARPAHPVPAARPRWPGRAWPSFSTASTLPHWLLLAAILVRLFTSQGENAAKQREQLELMVPVTAADFIERHGLRGRMFNVYEHGGYLIYRFAPSLPVLVDGRADVYGDAFLTDYLRTYNAQAGWKPMFDGLHIDFALLPRDAPLRQVLLAEKSFRDVHRDAHNVVMVRVGDPRYERLPVLPDDFAKSGR